MLLFLPTARLIAETSTTKDRFIRKNHANLFIRILHDTGAFRNEDAKKQTNYMFMLRFDKEGQPSRSMIGQSRCDLMDLMVINGEKLSKTCLFRFFLVTVFKDEDVSSLQVKGGYLRNEGFMICFRGRRVRKS